MIHAMLLKTLFWYSSNGTFTKKFHVGAVEKYVSSSFREAKHEAKLYEPLTRIPRCSPAILRKLMTRTRKRCCKFHCILKKNKKKF